MKFFFWTRLCQVGSVGSVSATRTVGREFASRPCHTKDHHKNDTNCLHAWHAMHKGRSLAVQPNCLKGRVVCRTVYGEMHLKSPGIIRKSRVSYPVPGFLSSATWPSLPKKHFNGLNQTKPIFWTSS